MMAGAAGRSPLMALVFAAQILAALPTSAHAEPPPPEVRPIPVVEVAEPGSAAVDLRILFALGSANDPAGLPGLTELTARLLVRGATRERSYSELLAELYPMAATFDVHVSRQQVVFTTRVHRDHAMRLCPLLLEALTQPALGEADFQRVRSEVRSELADGLRAADDEALVREVLGLALYEGHPFGHLPLGTLASLGRITVDDVRAHYRRAFVQSAVVVGIGGDAPPDLREALTTGLRELGEGEPGRRGLPAPPPVAATRAVLIEKNVRATSIALGYPIDVRRGDPDYYPLLVAVSFLGEHRQLFGRLFRTLRVRRGLSYGAYAYMEAFEQEGWSVKPRPNMARSQQAFSIWIRPVPHDKRELALRLAVLELSRLVEHGLTPADLVATKDFLIGYRAVLEETTSRRVGYRLDDRFYGADSSLEATRSALAEVTLEQVDAAIRKHLRADRLTIVAVTKDARAFERELLDPTPIPVRYDSPKPREVLDEDEAAMGLDLGLAEGHIRIIPDSELFVEVGLPRGEGRPEKSE